MFVASLASDGSSGFVIIEGLKEIGCRDYIVYAASIDWALSFVITVINGDWGLLLTYWVGYILHTSLHMSFGVAMI